MSPTRTPATMASVMNDMSATHQSLDEPPSPNEPVDREQARAEFSHDERLWRRGPGREPGRPRRSGTCRWRTTSERHPFPCRQEPTTPTAEKNSKAASAATSSANWSGSSWTYSGVSVELPGVGEDSGALVGLLVGVVVSAGLDGGVGSGEEGDEGSVVEAGAVVVGVGSVVTQVSTSVTGSVSQTTSADAVPPVKTRNAEIRPAARVNDSACHIRRHILLCAGA
jgi:hypothetical protein